VTEKKTITRPSGPQTDDQQLHAAESDQPSPLLQQAAAYGKVARESLEDCQRGAEAEQELEKRRNQSGQ